MTTTSPPLPNFFVVGTPKSATASLSRYLADHPDACMSRHWEPHYFAIERVHALGLDFYRSLFSHYNGEQAIGEKSWRYSCRRTYPQAWSRLKQTVPDFKVIYVVREPFSRAKSMWRELIDAAQDELSHDPGHSICNDTLIVETCLYHDQIKPIIDDVGRDKVLLLFFEDYRRDPYGFYDQVCDFLEIARHHPAEVRDANPSVGQRMDGRIARLLRKVGVISMAARLVPWAKPLGHRLLRKSLGEVHVSPAAEMRFREMVAEDSRLFLELAGKPADFWSPAPASPPSAGPAPDSPAAA